MFEYSLACVGKGNHVCLPGAGTAYRAACEAVCDMEELETNLRLTTWERMQKHDRKLNDWLEFEAFLEKLERGRTFIKSQHGNPR